MSLKDQIINELKKENYLSDRELTDRIYGINALQQPVNHACRQLVTSGCIKRTLPPIKNYIKTVQITDLDKVPAVDLTKDFFKAANRISKALENSSVAKSEYLKNEFNGFWNSFWKTKDRDCFSEISLDRLVQLKMAVVNINNFITHEITIRSAKIIGKILKQSDVEINRTLRLIESTSTNSNSYDIECRDNPAYICEVKANLPVHGTTFGTAQRQQIVKDILGLINGKTKSSITSEQMGQYYKFLCMYQEKENVIQAVNRLISGLEDQVKGKVKLYQPSENITLDNVYVIFIKLRNNKTSEY